MSAASQEAPVFYQRPALASRELEQFQQIYEKPVDASVNYFSHQLSELATFGRSIANDHGLTNTQTAALLREASWEMLAKRGDKRSKAYEVSVYAGCQHGQIMKDFDWLVAHPPDFLFVSDLAGSDFEAKSKAIFYNRIINHVRNFVGQDVLRQLDQEEVRKLVTNRGKEIINLTIDKAGAKLLLGYHELFRFVKDFSPGDISLPNPANKVEVIHWLGQFTPKDQNHGTWMGSLDRETRKAILSEISSKTIYVIDKLKLLRDHGTEVLIVSGNWDGPESLDIIAYGDGKPENAVKVDFNVIDYLKSENFIVSEDLTALDTGTTFTVMAPFFWLLRNFEKERLSDEYQHVVRIAQEARRQGRHIVLYPHAALQHLETSGPNQIVAKNTFSLMRDFNMDEIVHGHDHVPSKEHTLSQYPRYNDAFVDYVPKGNIALAVRRKNRILRIGQNVLPAKIM